MLKIIDRLTGYKDKETFDNFIGFSYEINHSILKLSKSIKTLLDIIKTDQIKYVKISKNSILQKDEEEPEEKIRHFFDYLMTNMIYDIINHANNTFITNKIIKIYMNNMIDVIENFDKYPYDVDDFNRMNYGIFVNDSKKYGGNCQIFSMIFELINYCSKDDYLKTMFINLCSDNNYKKYYIELMNNEEELLKDVLKRKIKNSRLNIVFWLVSLDIMMKLNRINENAYVITDSLLESGFVLTSEGIVIKTNVRTTNYNETNCVFYICDEFCHVGYLTPLIVFDIDNMNKPSNIYDFINRACDYYNFNKFNLTKYYYNNTTKQLF